MTFCHIVARGYFVMIKSTFYNLSDAKRERVIRAIMQEFAVNESEKVSINRIIKNADISRGSFYQYFDDKVDLVEVVFKSLMDMALGEAFRAVSVSNGDVFYVYSKLLDIIASFHEDEEQRSIVHNLVINMHENDSLIAEYLSTRCKGFSEMSELYDSLSRENLRFRSDADVLALQQILNDVLKSAVFQIYVQNEEFETVRGDFARKLAIIERGAML